MEPRCRDSRGSSALIQHVSETEIAEPIMQGAGQLRDGANRWQIRWIHRCFRWLCRGWCRSRRALTILQAVRSKRRAAADCGGERALVEIVEFAADRYAVREPRYFNVAVVQEVGDVVRGALAVDRGVERQDQFLHRRVVRPL